MASAKSARRSQIGTLRALTWAERGVLAEAGAAVVCVRVLVKAAGLQRVRNLLARFSPAMEKETADAARAAHISRLVDMAARHTPLSSTCLHRSLVLWWLLRRRGVHSTLRFGARKRDDHFEAHAWVECAGMAINDDPMIHRDYTSLEFALFKPDA